VSFFELLKKQQTARRTPGHLGPTPTASSGLYDRPGLEDPSPPPLTQSAGLISSNMSLRRSRAGKTLPLTS
jgi:hypothetical protein